MLKLIWQIQWNQVIVIGQLKRFPIKNYIFLVKILLINKFIINSIPIIKKFMKSQISKVKSLIQMINPSNSCVNQNIDINLAFIVIKNNAKAAKWNSVIKNLWME